MSVSACGENSALRTAYLRETAHVLKDLVASRQPRHVLHALDQGRCLWFALYLSIATKRGHPVAARALSMGLLLQRRLADGCRGRAAAEPHVRPALKRCAKTSMRRARHSCGKRTLQT